MPPRAQNTNTPAGSGPSSGFIGTTPSSDGPRGNETMAGHGHGSNSTGSDLSGTPTLHSDGGFPSRSASMPSGSAPSGVAVPSDVPPMPFDGAAPPQIHQHENGRHGDRLNMTEAEHRENCKNKTGSQEAPMNGTGPGNLNMTAPTPLPLNSSMPVNMTEHCRNKTGAGRGDDATLADLNLSAKVVADDDSAAMSRDEAIASNAGKGTNVHMAAVIGVVVGVVFVIGLLGLLWCTAKRDMQKKKKKSKTRGRELKCS